MLKGRTKSVHARAAQRGDDTGAASSSCSALAWPHSRAQTRHILMLTWEYEGAERDEEDDPMQFCQMGLVGCLLKHDVFGLCTHLDDASVAAGSFKVRINSDGSVKELTQGHFQVAFSASNDVSVQKPTVAAGIAEPDGKQNTFCESSEASARAKLDGDDGVGDEDPRKPESPGNQGEDEDEQKSGDKIDADKNDDGSSANKKDGKPSNNEGKPHDEVSNNDDAPEESPIFKQVVEAMTEQHKKYGLEPDALSLAWYKSMVMLDTRGVKLIPTSNGDVCGSDRLLVKQCIRDRTTGYFFVVCGIYKPLLGFLVDRNDGVVLDQEGPQHTLQLAMTSRMLGGNTGYFSGEEESLILCMHNKQRFKNVWLSCTRGELAKVFDLSPRKEDAQHAFEDDLQAYAETAVTNFKSTWHAVDVERAEGATVIKEDLLRGVNHFRTDHNRRKPKPYLTESEGVEAAKLKALQKEAQEKAKAAARAEEDKAKAAAKAAKEATKKKPPAATRKAADIMRKRARSIRVDDGTTDDEDGGDAEQLGGSISTTAFSSPAKCQRPIRQPPQPQRNAVKPSPAAVPRQQQPTPAAAPPADAAPPTQQQPAAGAQAAAQPASVGAQQDIAQHMHQQPQQQPVHIAANTRTEELPTAQQNTNQNVPQHVPQHAHATAQAQQQQHTALPMMHGLPFPQQQQAYGMQQPLYNTTGVPQLASNPPHAPHLAHLYASAFPFSFGAPSAQMPVPNMPGMQPMLHAAAYHNYMLHHAFPSATAPPVKPPQDAEPSMSPSLAAIKARIVYEGKREKDLQEAQALHEYYQAKMGVK